MMREILVICSFFMKLIAAHHDVHLIPASILCQNVPHEHNILLPSPNDCSVYYRCENGMAVPESCPPGLEWCKVLSECTLPLLANCTIGHKSVTYSPDELSTYSTEKTTTVTPSVSHNICPIGGAILPSPFNCHEYFICVNEEPVVRSCPDNQIYSCWDQTCEVSSDNCIKSGNQTGRSCKTENSVIPNIDDCSTYYKCVNGTVQLESCKLNTYFNQWFGKCVDKSVAYCDSYLEVGSTTTSTPITLSPVNDNCPMNGAMLPNPFNCNSYFICENGVPESRNCPNDEEYSCWDQKCTTSADCITSGNQTGHECKNNNQTIQNINDCTRYYQCVNGVVKLEKCPDNKYFNKWFGICVNQVEAHCNVSAPETASTSTSAPPHNPLCPDETHYLYPAYNDCSGYMECENYVLVKKKCNPPTFNYNCEKKICENITHCCAPTAPSTAGTTGLTSPSELTSSDPVSQTPSTETSGNPSETTTGSNTEPSGPSSGTNPSETTTEANTGSSGPGSETNPSEPTTGSNTEPSGPSSGTNPSETTTEANTGSSGPGSETNPSEPTTGSNTEPSGPSSGTNPSETTTGGISNPLCPGNGTYMYPAMDGDCSGYMQCENGKLIKKKCDPPTFNYNCHAKKCENIEHCCAPTRPASVSTTEITITTQESTTVTINSPSLNENMCPYDNVLLPNPMDCTSYFICKNNSAVSQKCPPRQIYSCWDQMCKPAEGSTCIKEGSQEGNSCTKEGEKMPKIDDCSSYYQCSNGVIENVRCPANTYYNSWFKQCYNYSLSWCETYPTNPPLSTSRPPLTTIPISSSSDVCPMEGARLPNPLDCHLYFVCLNNKPISMSCPDGYDYSCWDQKCLPQSESSCIIFGNAGDNCTIEKTQLPNVRDCSSYYECRNGSIVSVTCPNGKQYNSWFKKCVDDVDAHCKLIPTTTGYPVTHTPTTSTIRPEAGLCPNDGARLPNPVNCTSYYVCNNNKPILHECPEGEEYSCWDQVCQKPSANSTCIQQGSQQGHSCKVQGEMLPNIANCGSYYICIKGVVEMQFCAEGTFYSQWFKTCLSASLVFCKTFPTLPPIVFPTLRPTTPPPSTTNDLCPIEHALIPNPIDCATYYECINNAPILQKCPVGMEYSCWDQQCVNATDAKCISSGLQSGQRCSKNGLTVPNIEDCGSYYECILGTVVLRRCLFGQKYNKNYRKCVAAELAHCDVYSTLPPSTTSHSITTSAPSSIDACPEEGTLLPNPLNCSTYYKCINGTPELQLCASGYEYSCWDMQCKPADEAQCVSEGDHTDKVCSRNGQKIQKPENCHEYYECVNGIITTKKCLLNWYYNKWFGICVPLRILSHCNTTVTIKPTEKPHTTTITPDIFNDLCPIEGALLPNPLDCSGYFQCTNNKPVEKKCPHGHVYSCWDQSCVPEKEGQCISVGSHFGKKCSRDGVKLQNVESCSNYYECVNGKIERNYCFIGFSYNRWFQKCTLDLYGHCRMYSTSSEIAIEDSTTTVYNDNTICPKDGATVPNPTDCHTYFVCEKSKPVLHSCPTGKNYDCWNQKCNSIYLTKCVNVPSAYVGQDCEKNGVTIPNINNCNKYYECDKKKIVEKRCPLLMQYSVWGHRCVVAGLARCANNKFLGII